VVPDTSGIGLPGYRRQRLVLAVVDFDFAFGGVADFDFAFGGLAPLSMRPW
jgi:hypothetical protein